MKQLYLLLLAICLLSSCGRSSSEEQGKTPSPDFLYPVETVNDAVAIVNVRTGEELPGQFASAEMFFEGVALVRDRHSLLYGYIKPSGDYAIEPKYASATNFSNGIAFVALPDSGLIAINRSGKELFALPEVEVVRPYISDFATGQLTSGEACLIDTKGEITKFDDGTIPIPIAFWSDRILVMSQEDKFGMMQKTGLQTIPCEYDYLGVIPNSNLLVYRIDKRFGLLSDVGLQITGPDFDNITLSEDLLLVETDNRWGVIDLKGNTVIPQQFEEIIPDGDLFLVRQNDLYGWCDSKGKFVINPQFKEVAPFGKEKLTPVRSGEDFGYIDKKGKFAINPQFSMAGSFYKGLAPAIKSNDRDNKIGYINEKGDFEIKPQFDKASSFGDDFALIMQDYKLGFIDREGLYAINPQFTDILLSKEIKEFPGQHVGNSRSYYAKKRYLPIGGTAFFFKDYLLPVKTPDEKIVFIDKNGKYMSSLYEGLTDEATAWHTMHVAVDRTEAQNNKTDIQPIVDRLSSCINSIDLQQNAQQLKEKYGLKESQFKDDLTVILSRESAAYFNLILKAECSPWIRVSDGWFGYKKVFNEKYVPKYYDVELTLTGKADDKGYAFTDSLLGAISKQLNMTNNIGQLGDKKIELLSEYEGSFLFRITK